MKFIITENQFNKIVDKFKPILFKYWNVNGPSLSRQMYKLIGLDSKTAYEIEPYFLELMIEWFGGNEKFIQYLKKDEGETFDIVDGGYNFKIILDEVVVNEEVYLYIRVKKGGTVTLIFDDNEPTISLEEALANDKFGWEINSEVNEIIFNKFFSFYSNLGVTIGHISVDYM
jgi:hypothetical protein